MGRIGFIGLGIMGGPMALNMLKGGSDLLVYDIDKNAVSALVEKGASYGTLKEIGQECDIIFTILPNGAIVKAILFGDGGVATGIKEGAVVVDMSSVTPIDSKECYDGLQKYGAQFLDAPVSGGEPKAIDGTLSFMVGGDEEAFQKALPAIKQMGTSAVLVGGSGSGSVTKLANQIIVNTTIAAVSEAMVLAAKAGVDPEKVYNAIRGGLAGSTVLDAKAPMMFNRDFKPGGKISINHKDIKNVMATAHSLDVILPFSAQLFEVMQALKVDGRMDEDHSAIVKYFEKLSNVEVAKDRL